MDLDGDGAIELSRWSRDSGEIHAALKVAGVKPVDPENYDPDNDETHYRHDDEYRGDWHDGEHHHDPESLETETEHGAAQTSPSHGCVWGCRVVVVACVVLTPRAFSTAPGAPHSGRGKLFKL